MKALGRRVFHVLAALLGLLLLALAAYDVWVFQPYRPDIDKFIARAGASETQPPVSLQRVLDAAYGDRLSGLVARQVLLELGVTAGESKLGGHATSALWALLLEVHLSAAQRTTLFLSLSYLGKEQRGFEFASTRIVGVPLAQVSVEQAATLVTVGKAPNSYLTNPDRLAQSARRLSELVSPAP